MNRTSKTQVNMKMAALLLFFLPSGLTTLNSSSYLQNTYILNNSIIAIIVKILLWSRNIIALFYIARYFIKIIRGHKIRKKSISLLPLFFFFLSFVFITTVLTKNNASLYSVAVELIVCFGFCCVLDNCLINKPDKTLEFLNKFFQCVLFVNFFLILLHPNGITAGFDESRTAYYLIGTKNQATPMLIFASFIQMAMYKREKDLTRFILSGLNIVVNALLMKSATGVTAVIVYYVLFLYNELKPLKQRRGNIKKFIIIALVLSVYAGVVFFGIQEYLGWFIEGVLGKDVTLTSRTLIWNRALEQIPLSPFIGYGYDYRVVMGYYSHNLLLELLITTGIIGTILYIFILIKAIKNAFISKTENFVIISFVILMIINLTEAFIYRTEQIAVIEMLSLYGYIYCSKKNPGEINI
jgi:O-antigen ligase